MQWCVQCDIGNWSIDDCNTLISYTWVGVRWWYMWKYCCCFWSPVCGSSFCAVVVLLWYSVRHDTLLCSPRMICKDKLAVNVNCYRTNVLYYRYVPHNDVSVNNRPHTGCPRRNVPDFGRVFLMLNYTDITQNTYVQSWTVMEIMAREKCGLLAGPRTVPVSWQLYLCYVECGIIWRKFSSC